MYDARNVANQFIDRAIAVDDEHITPLKVIKLVYYSHGWMMALHNRALIRQKVEAWEHGPVIRDVYRAVKKWGYEPVDETINADPENFDDTAITMIDDVYNHFGKYTGAVLWDWTHKPGTPWDRIWYPEGKRRWESREAPMEIPNSLIKEYFTKAKDEFVVK